MPAHDFGNRPTMKYSVIPEVLVTHPRAESIVRLRTDSGCSNPPSSRSGRYFLTACMKRAQLGNAHRIKTEHAGAKHGNGAYWGPKKDAKKESKKIRRWNWKRS